ncbi:c-type cytochrome [Tepidamorphus sp. 3E244]|uniref:c-type cytochrome n=1 Tax=Tepidamorphus sp. 3E244 TaxID=3385498 RepID=UPI0038FD139F
MFGSIGGDRVVAVVAALVAAMVVLGLGWRFISPGESAGLLEPGDDAIVAQGEALYADHCASCHGTSLEGEADWRSRKPDGMLPAPPHDESGHTWHHPDQMLFEITKYGVQRFAGEDYRSDMPAYEGVLSDAEIIAVLSYIKSRWSSELQARHDTLNQRP